MGVPLPHVAVHDAVAFPYSSIIRYSHVYAVDTSAGELLWEFRAPDAIETPPTVVGDTVYVGSDGKMYALDAATGELRWMYDTALLRGPSEGLWPRIFAAPIVVDAMVYVGTVEEGIGEPFEEGHSVVYALDAATGYLVWHRRTDGAGDYLQEEDGVLFLTSRHGIQPTWGVDPPTEWESPLLASRHGIPPTWGMDPPTEWESPLLASRHGIPPTWGMDPPTEWESPLLNGYLHVLDAATGNMIWTGRTNGNPISTTGIDEDVLYVHSIDEYAYTHYGNANALAMRPEEHQYVTAFSVATGQPLWFYRARRFSSVLTTTEHGLVFVSLPGGWVYALTEP